LVCGCNELYRRKSINSIAGLQPFKTSFVIINESRIGLEQINLDIHRDIVEAAMLGTRSAQYKLYSLYSKAMFNICLRMLNHREEAEDILQEAFTEAFRKLESFRFESTFGAWLKQIVVNRCINAIKQKKADIVFIDEMERFDDRIEENSELPGLSVEKVRKAMQALPEGGRVVFSLYLLEGYDHAEISEILGITESTSKTQYMRAKNRVRDIIQQMETQDG